MSEAPTVVEDQLDFSEIPDGDPVPEEPQRLDAPVRELLPLILVGDWVRLAATHKVPDSLVGRLATVTDAALHQAPGQDSICDTPYSYQRPSDLFSVRVRETGDVIVELTRDAFASFGPMEAQVDRYKR